MSLSVAVQMDHIASIRLAGDSTFALMLEAQKRGHSLFHYTPDKLTLRSGRVTAAIEPVVVRDEPGNHFTLGSPEKTDLSTLDVVLLRQDPPFDMAYLSTTYMLERIHPSTLVVNDPAEVRDAPEKLLVMNYPELMPETIITRDPEEIRAFRAEFGDIVLKPLYGAGGQGVYHVKPDDDNFSAFLELFMTQSRDPFIAQRYLPAVRAGDKRIILVDGKFAGLVNRVPAEGDLRSNMVRGGAAATTEVSKRDLEICEAIGPELRDRGLIFVGIDVIGDKLTEINVTSPTGIRAIKRLGGPDVAALVWDAIESHF
ncbi:glutathione synthase [Pleomorphomonas diazotrophica]|uniref:Glutathione synthetase n=1 Tax=Pleomorphomonas diazotrophica TaxID=1166257 RepID=A0A1I4SSF8_9HYPH|nr:glutathione synthase [Pleomorphomonas diazotrophica]PKR88505.1 glutathione synthase [Pleomorphomonas diazotrophica]SFM67426.1 glutathione synthase [Pleomorphomonas diazotrophica]